VLQLIQRPYFGGGKSDEGEIVTLWFSKRDAKAKFNATSSWRGGGDLPRFEKSHGTKRAASQTLRGEAPSINSKLQRLEAELRRNDEEHVAQFASFKREITVIYHAYHLYFASSRRGGGKTCGSMRLKSWQLDPGAGFARGL
jgi:hypothetical protein